MMMIRRSPIILSMKVLYVSKPNESSTFFAPKVSFHVTAFDRIDIDIHTTDVNPEEPYYDLQVYFYSIDSSK